MKKLIVVIMLFFIAVIVHAESNISLYQDMVVTDNLRIRTPKYDDRKIVTVLNAGTKVKIIDIGEEETIDGIKSNWVEVEVQKNATDKDGNNIPYGVVGWCFGGYLKETKQIDYKHDYGNGNGMIISESDNDKQKLIIRKHIQEVKIGDLARGEERIIYSDTNKSKMLYNLQDDDELEISEILFVNSKEDNINTIWLKVNCNGISGFIYFSSDPYKNNRWEIIEKIDSKWTVRKLTQTLAVFSQKDEIELRDKPGEKDSKVIFYVPSSYKNGQGQINFEIEAVTEEIDTNKGNDRWVRITYNGRTGWVYGGYLSAERGGPKYFIPDNVVEFSLSWY